MDWKTNVLLFVLVLFGSVVPVSAQSEGAGGMTAEVWAIISVGVVLLGVILASWRENRTAHTKIGDKVDTGFRVVNTDIKELNRSVGRIEGALGITGRPSEGGQD